VAEKCKKCNGDTLIRIVFAKLNIIQCKKCGWLGGISNE